MKTERIIIIVLVVCVGILGFLFVHEQKERENDRKTSLEQSLQYKEDIIAINMMLLDSVADIRRSSADSIALYKSQLTEIKASLKKIKVTHENERNRIRNANLDYLRSYISDSLITVE